MPWLLECMPREVVKLLEQISLIWKKGEATNEAANEQGRATEAATSSCNNGEATTSSNIGGQSSASKPGARKVRIGASDGGQSSTNQPLARRTRICGDDGGQSLTSQPLARRARIGGDDDLGYMLLSGLEKLSEAIVQTAAASVDSGLPNDLYDNLIAIPGFEEAHLVHYYAYLCDNPAVARAFNNLSLSNKMVWVAQYIKEHIPGI